MVEQVNKHERNWGYAGIISKQEYREKKSLFMTPLISGIEAEAFSYLKDGDIVALMSNGQVNVFWETHSKDNAILCTEQCNCRCIMCPQPYVTDPEKLFEFNLKLIGLIDPKKTERIGITGGEPTLLEDKLFKMIRYCRNRLPNTSIELLTNGINFKDLSFARKLAEINHPALVLCIPLYADNDSEHDRIIAKRGGFYETINGLHNLALFRQKIEIRIVVQALNFKRLLPYAEFIFRNFPFVIHIAFMGLETIGSARKNLKKVWIDPIEYMPQLLSAVKYLDRRAMNVSIYNLQLCILPKELWRFSRQSISSWKRTYLSQCDGCQIREKCGGVFSTSGGIHSRFIKPFEKN